MNRIDMLSYMLDITFDQEEWYAPLKDAIEGITAEQANWKPTGEAAKSIWENVNHLIYYREKLATIMEGREWTNDLDGNETFNFITPSNDDQKWKEVVERAEKVHGRLRNVLSKTTDEELDRNFLKEKLVNLMLHDAYHTGQIIQIRKMQGSWPTHR